jgi:hypothetical protein
VFTMFRFIHLRRILRLAVKMVLPSCGDSGIYISQNIFIILVIQIFIWYNIVMGQWYLKITYKNKILYSN